MKTNTQGIGKPEAALIASIVGAIIGLFFGILQDISLTISFDNYGLLGVYVTIMSSLVIFCAVMLYKKPANYRKWGGLIVILSVLGLFTIVAIIGGIIALVYTPLPSQKQDPSKTSTDR